MRQIISVYLSSITKSLIIKSFLKKDYELMMFNYFYLKSFILLFKHSLLLYSPLFFTVHNNQQYFQNPLLY